MVSARGEGIILTPNKVRVLEGLRRHHPLPTPLLFKFWPGTGGGGYTYFLEVLTKLTHEKTGGGPYVVRPLALNPSYGAKCEPCWYALSSAGHSAVDGLSAFALPAKKDAEHHRAMGACLGASFEVLAPGHGLTFLHAEDIFAHPRCSHLHQGRVNPFLIPNCGGQLEPDDLFGLRYADGFWFFAREDDRATESFERSGAGQTSLKSKIDRYLALLSSGAYQGHWGVPNLKILFATTAPNRIPLMKSYLADKPHADCFLFKAFPTFGVQHWRAPRGPVLEVYEPWETLGSPFNIMRG